MDFCTRPSDTLKGALDVFNRIPQNDWAAMRAAHGTVGFGQLLQEPFHFVLFERHVDLDGGVASDTGSDPGTDLFEVERLLFAFDLLEDFMQQVFDFGGRDAGGGGLHRDGADTEGLDLETV